MGYLGTNSSRSKFSAELFAVFSNLIKQAGSINALTADKAYDQIDVYQAAIDHGSTDLKLLVHPRTDAVISASNQATLRQRDVHVKSIREDGVLAWRRTSGYYHQSAVENLTCPLSFT